MITSRRAALLVGATIIASAAALAITIAYLRGALAARSVYHLEAVFPDALGIREQARVYLAGVEVGEVQKVWLTPDLRARVRMALRKEVEVPIDTVAVVMSPGIAGVEKLIALIPGNSPQRATEGTELKGTKEPGISDIAPVAQETLQEMQKLVRTANTLLSDQQMQQSMRQTLENVEVASRRLTVLLKQAEKVLASAGNSFDSVVKDTHRATRLLPQVVNDLQALLEQSRELVLTAQHATESFDKFVSDEQLQQDLRDAARQMNILGGKLNQITEDIGKYTGDEELRQSVVGTVSEAQATLVQARQATERINQFVERLIQPGRIAIQPVEVSLDVYGLLRSSAFRTDLTLSFPYRNDRFIDLGVYDVTESNKFILQYGSKLASNLDLRYGLYASKPGVGFSWKLRPGMQLRVDAFDPNNLHVNTRANIPLGNDWSMWVGLDSLFRANQPLLGLRLVR